MYIHNYVHVRMHVELTYMSSAIDVSTATTFVGKSEMEFCPTKIGE